MHQEHVPEEVQQEIFKEAVVELEASAAMTVTSIGMKVKEDPAEEININMKTEQGEDSHLMMTIFTT